MLFNGVLCRLSLNSWAELSISEEAERETGVKPSTVRYGQNLPLLADTAVRYSLWDVYDDIFLKEL